MPRPRHAQGRPSTPVIPGDFEIAHRPVIAAATTTTVALRRPGTQQQWSDDEDQMVAVPRDPYWTGPAGVTATANQAQDRVTADDDETIADYLVTLPGDTTADVAVGDLVAVALDGLSLRVEQVLLGGPRFELDLHCTLTD